MAFVVARIELQSSKTVNGTPSRSQYVMRSEECQELMEQALPQWKALAYHDPS